MWSAPAKNMKKINISISFVYSVSIRGNCENAVFTFLLFYKQNINATQQKESFRILFALYNIIYYPKCKQRRQIANNLLTICRLFILNYLTMMLIPLQALSS